MNQTIYRDENNNHIRFSSVTRLELVCPFSGLGVKYVASGEETYYANDKKFSIRQGAYILGNDFTASHVRINQKEPVQGLCIDISARIIAEVAQYHDLNGSDLQEFLLSDQFFVNCYPVNNNRLGALLCEMNTRIKAGQFNSNAPQQDELFYSLAACVIADQRFVFDHLRKMEFKKNCTKEEVFRAILHAKSFIDEHLLENLSLDQISRQAGMSKYHFLRIFRKTFGLSPYQYQINIRLENARQELCKGKSIRDTALRYGYADAAAFSKAFKQAFGLSPGALKK